MSQKGGSSIIKVFPGVEFSVEFWGENGGTVVHVIAVFEDEDDEFPTLWSDHLTNR